MVVMIVSGRYHVFVGKKWDWGRDWDLAMAWDWDLGGLGPRSTNQVWAYRVPTVSVMVEVVTVTVPVAVAVAVAVRGRGWVGSEMSCWVGCRR